MKLPFKTHTIYITYNDGKIRELKDDFTTKEVHELKKPTKESPTMVLHQQQFDLAKGQLLSQNNPFRIKEEEAHVYYMIGFITKDELEKFIGG